MEAGGVAVGPGVVSVWGRDGRHGGGVSGWLLMKERRSGRFAAGRACAYDNRHGGAVIMGHPPGSLRGAVEGGVVLGGSLEEAHDAGEDDVEGPGVMPAKDAGRVEEEEDAGEADPDCSAGGAEDGARSAGAGARAGGERAAQGRSRRRAR